MKARFEQPRCLQILKEVESHSYSCSVCSAVVTKPPLWRYVKPSCCFPMKKKPNHFHISSPIPFRLLKAIPKATMFHPWKESFDSRPTKHPPYNLFIFFFLHLFAVTNCLNQNCGRPPWFSHPHAESLGLCRNTLALLRCRSPASGGSKSPQPSSQHFGNQREHIATWGLFVFTP